MDLSRAREGLLGGQISWLLLCPLPREHQPGHSSRLPSWERVKQICLGRSCRERVWSFGSGKKEIRADLGSPVVGWLGHRAPLAGGQFLSHQAPNILLCFQQGPSKRASRAPSPSPTDPGGLRGQSESKEAGCPGQLVHLNLGPVGAA